MCKITAVVADLMVFILVLRICSGTRFSRAE